MSSMHKQKVDKKSKRKPKGFSRPRTPSREGVNTVGSNMLSVTSATSQTSKKGIKKKKQGGKPQQSVLSKPNTNASQAQQVTETKTDTKPNDTRCDTVNKPSKPNQPLAVFTTKSGLKLWIICHFRNPSTHAEYVMKDQNEKLFMMRVEPVDRCKLKFHHEILTEMAKLAKPDEKSSIVQAIEYGSSSRLKANFLIMTPFGINFDEVLKLVKKFTIGCAFNIGLQALEGIRFYHQAGFINRNIKPATFCVGMGIDEFRVLLADFRLSRTHIEMKKVRKARPTVKYSGTSRYASIAALTCKDQGRKDDLESWIYMLYELIDREEGLSWRHIPRGPMLIKEKENFKAHVLPNTYNNVPADFKKIVDMVHSYSYDSEPDYKAIREIVESVGKAKNLDMSVCDWFGKITKDTQKTAIEIAKDRSTGNRCSGSDDFEFAAKKMVRKIMNEGDTIKNGSFTWIVKCLLGSGGFGDVYKVYDEKSEKKFYALKTESEDGRKAMLRLKVEMQVLMAINDARKKDATKQFYKHFVDFVDRGKSEDLRCKFIVMSLVGPSLDDVRKKYTVRLDNDRSGYIIAIQSVEAVRDLHSLGYLHRDIKPANFAVGFAADEWIVFMLDFGIGRSYLDPKTKEHRAPRKSVKFLGTLRFASRACMKGIDQGRKDDLECWLYMIFDIFDPESGLPWSKSKVRNDITSMKEKFFESKAEADDDSPTVLKELAVYVNGLRFQSTPDYEYIINRLLKFAGDSKSGTTNMQKGGWVGKLTEKNKKENQPDRFSASESDVPVTDDDSCTGN